MCQLASFVASKSSTQRTKVHNQPDILEEINNTLKINRLIVTKSRFCTGNWSTGGNFREIAENIDSTCETIATYFGFYYAVP
jgi:hypothetical protein